MPQKNTPITTGACAFCGQQLTVAPCETEVDADERATYECNCPGAKEARSTEEDRQARLNKRETTLKDAQADIKDLWGAGAEERGDRHLAPELLEHIYQACVFVYDQNLRRVKFTVSQGVTGTISRTNKGTLTIQRDDSTTTRREHKD